MVETKLPKAVQQAIFASESSLIIQTTYLVYSSISLQQACSGNFNEAVVLFCSNKAGELGGAIHAEKSNVTIFGSMYFALIKHKMVEQFY